MGALIQAIIDFFKSLFGGGSSQPASPGLPASSGQSAQSAAQAAPAPAAPPEEPYARRKWRETQELIAQVERGGVNLCGLDPRDPVGYWQKHFAVEEMQGQGRTFEDAIRSLGFTDRDHWDLVTSYIAAKWSRFGTNDSGEEDVIVDDEFTNAAMKARMGQMAAAQAAAAAADPNLLAPVGGVTVEAWAGASATLAGLGQTATAQQVAEVLARFGMDKAKYDQANAGWAAKMQGDTTGAIATKFGEAFAAAQGQAGGWSNQQAGGSGPEPVSFDKFVEIMAAQGAWAEQGIDVNAQLRATFGIDAATYSRYASYWSPKMATDMALMRRYTQLEAQYKKKYAGRGMDDDLSV